MPVASPRSVREKRTRPVLRHRGAGGVEEAVGDAGDLRTTGMCETE